LHGIHAAIFACLKLEATTVKGKGITALLEATNASFIKTSSPVV
jgi:hypothetical protein